MGKGVSFVVEKNVPVPPKGQRLHKNRGYRQLPIPDMEIGDSFYCATDDPMREARNMLDAARNYPVKLTTRRENGGIRVWRIA